MSSYPRMTYVVTRGLYAQRFRRVDLRDVQTTGAIRLPISAGAEVDAALRDLGADPNWIEVARQLAQLRLGGFSAVYLRRDKHDLELIPLYGFQGVLSLSTFQNYFDFVWSVTDSMKDILGSFTLSENQVRVLSYAASLLDGSPAPTKDESPQAPGAPVTLPPGEDAGPIGAQSALAGEGQAAQASAAATNAASWSPAQQAGNRAASLLRLICELSFSKTPATGVAAIGMQGASADLLAAARSSSSSLYKADRWGFDLVNTQQYAIVIDGRTFAVESNVTRVGSLDIGQLKQALPFLARVG